MELAPPPAPSEEQKKRDELWNTYLVKACDVGQLDYHVKTLNSQLLEVEKKLEVARNARNKAAREHDEYLKVNAPKLNITPPPVVKQEDPAIELEAVPV